MITSESINAMNYSEFVGLIQERNRPSWGIRTIQDVAVNARINKHSRMLEIGSNTGFTCVNMSLLTGCRSVGIDLNTLSVAESIRYAHENGVAGLTEFMEASALSLPFEDQSFDFVWCSNVTSFIEDKERAISEYLRVLKDGGTLIVVPIYYLNPPPANIVQEVSDAIGTEIKVWDKQFWIEKFEAVSASAEVPLIQYHCRDYWYLDRTHFLQNYRRIFENREHLSVFPSEVRQSILRKLDYFMSLFNENLKYASFSILLFQKRTTWEEPELFLTVEL